jgi:hypothetical protein
MMRTRLLNRPQQFYTFVLQTWWCEREESGHGWNNSLKDEHPEGKHAGFRMSRTITTFFSITITTFFSIAITAFFSSTITTLFSITITTFSITIKTYLAIQFSNCQQSLFKQKCQ